MFWFKSILFLVFCVWFMMALGLYLETGKFWNSLLWFFDWLWDSESYDFFSSTLPSDVDNDQEPPRRSRSGVSLNGTV